MTGAYARLSKYACTVGNRGVSSILTSTQPRHTTVESLSAWADSSVLQPGSDKARYRNYYLSNSDVPAWQLRVHKVRPGTSGRHVIPATRAGSVQWKKPRKERHGAVGQAPAHHQPRYPHPMFSHRALAFWTCFSLLLPQEFNNCLLKGTTPRG